MGSRVTTYALEVVGIADDRFKIENASANTAASLTSDYTEAGGQTGQAVPRDARSSAVPMLHGAQSADLEIVALRGGNPGRAELGYRPAGAADTEVRGWQPPGQLVRWESAFTTTVNDVISWATAVTPSGHVVTVHQNNSTGLVRSATWDPSTQTLGAAVTVANTSIVTVNGGITAIGLPSGRVVVSAAGDRQGWAWYSDDNGATWATYAVRQDEDASAAYGAVLVSGSCYSAGQVCTVTAAPGGTTVYQLASRDLCQSLELVTSLATADSPWCVALPDGSIIVGYRDTGDSRPYIRRIGAAYASIGDVEAVEVHAAGISECHGVAMEDGTLVCMIRINDFIFPKYSFDRGLTWTTGTGLDTNDSATVPRVRSTAWSSGQIVMVGDALANPGTQDESVFVSVWGQWTNLTVGAYNLLPQGVYTDLDFGSRENAGRSVSYLGGLDLPQNVGAAWTRTTSGTASQTLTGATTVLSTGAGTEFYDYNPTAGATVVARWQVLVTNGGSTTTSNCVMRIRASDAVSADYRLDVRFSTTAFRLYDVNAGTALAAAVTFDCAAGIECFAEVVPVGSAVGVCQFWYRAIGGAAWVSGGSYTLTSAALLTSAITWGHVTSATTDSTWKMVLVSAFNGPTQRYRLGIDGTGMPISAIPVATHEYGTTATRLAISLASGPARPREVWDVASRYDYPIEALDLRITGTPRRRWRSQSEDDAFISWDLGSAQQLGLVVMAFPYFNGADINLQSSTGGAWTTRMTASTTVGSSATWTAAGALLTLGGAISGRYVQRNELVGGSVLFGTSGEVRRITANTAGYLGATGAGDLVARLTVEGLTGAETGTATVRAPRCMEVNDLSTSARYWRLRFTNGALAAATPDGYWEAVGGIFRGVALAGPAWGSQVQEVRPQVDRVQDRQGGTYQRRRGDSVRTWTSHWQDGRWAGMHRDEDSTNGSDSVALGNGGDSNALNDIGFALAGLVDVGAELPWVAVHNASLSLGSTDRSRWIVGYLDGAISMGSALGDEATTDELIRVESITLTEYA